MQWGGNRQRSTSAETGGSQQVQQSVQLKGARLQIKACLSLSLTLLQVHWHAFGSQFVRRCLCPWLQCPWSSGGSPQVHTHEPPAAASATNSGAHLDGSG